MAKLRDGILLRLCQKILNASCIELPCSNVINYNESGVNGKAGVRRMIMKIVKNCSVKPTQIIHDTVNKVNIIVNILPLIECINRL